MANLGFLACVACTVETQNLKGIRTALTGMGAWFLLEVWEVGKRNG